MCWLDKGLAGGCRGAVAVQAIVCRGLSVISPIACEMGHRSRRDAFMGLSRVGEGGAKNKGRKREGGGKGGWRSPSQRTSPLRPPPAGHRGDFGRSWQVSRRCGRARPHQNQQRDMWCMYIFNFVCSRAVSGAGGSAHLKNQSLLKPAKTEELI